MSGYVYKESRVFISKEDILLSVTQEEIFKVVFGYLPEQHRYSTSPFREDNTPDCYFEWYKDTLYFIDWAEPIHKRHHRDCFNAIQDYHGVSFYKALEIINDHFKLNLLSGHHDDSDYVKGKKAEIKEKKEQKKTFKEMPFKARVFNSGVDGDYWLPFEISRSNLFSDDVFPIIWYKVYSRKLKNYVIIRPQTRSYLVGNFGERVKFYTPDKKGKGKWATNCNQNDVWGINDLPLRGKTLIITKSYKDWRVLKNQGLTVIGFQNEGMIPDDEILIPLLERFKDIVILFDNDRAGIEAAQRIVDMINTVYPRKARYVHLNSSLQRSQISDPADLISKKGKELLTEFLLNNNLK